MGHVFHLAWYMNGVGFGDSSRTSVPKIMASDPPVDLHRIISGFHVAFATGVACQQGMLTPPDTCIIPLLGACICIDTSFPDSTPK